VLITIVVIAAAGAIYGMSRHKPVTASIVNDTTVADAPGQPLR
jgi:hypothetical protein